MTELEPLPPIHREVFRHLPKGMGRLMPSKELAQRVGIEFRHLHKIIYDLNTVYGIPVGSIRDSDGGLFIPITEEERHIGGMALRKQHDTMAKRLKAYDNAKMLTTYRYGLRYKAEPYFKQFEQLTLDLGMITVQTDMKTKAK